jgi:hypothetical protein
LQREIILKKLKDLYLNFKKKLMKNIILKEYCKSILTFLAVGLIILLLLPAVPKKDSSKTTESTKIESTDKSKLTSPKIRIECKKKLKRSTIRTRQPPSRG